MAIMKKKHKNPILSFRPDDVTNQVIREIAEKEDRTLATVIKRAVRLYAEQNGYEWPAPKKE